MAIAGTWTLYGRQQAHKAATGAIPQPSLVLALFSGTANPAASPAELTLAGYGRVGVTFAESTDPDVVMTAVDAQFGPLAAGTYKGLAVMDDPFGGGTWFWGDSPTTLTIPGSSVLLFAAGDVTSTLI